MIRSTTHRKLDSIQKGIIDALTPNQLTELNEALKEADRGETISSGEFKKELVEWRKRASKQEVPK